MPSIDKNSGIQQVISLNTQAIIAAGTNSGNWINNIKQNNIASQFRSLEFIVQIGAMATPATTLALVLEEADLADYSDAAAVDPKFILAAGGLAACSAALNAANTSCRFGYVGQKTFVRVKVVTTGGASSFTIGGIAILGDPRFSPTFPDISVGSVG